MDKRLLKNILLGTAVGDALGFPVQFLDREYVRRNPVVGMTSGRWSDDTSLSLCLADSLRKGYDLKDIADKFVGWLMDGLWTPEGWAFDIGMTTYRAICNLDNGVEPWLAGMDRERDNGNGSLMRISPLIPYLLDLPSAEERIWVVSEVSSLTHRHPRSILACVYLCEFGMACVGCGDVRGAFAHAQEVIRALLRREGLHGEGVHFERLVDEPFERFRAIPEEEIRSTGYVIDTLEASLWSLFNHDNFKDTLLAAVNLGHDADTVGAVTGAMAGVVYGWEAIPAEWIEGLARKDDIIALAD